MSSSPEIFKDGFGPSWRVVEAFDLKTGSKLFSIPNTVYQGHLITAEMQPSGPEIKGPVYDAFWETIGIARRRFKIWTKEF